MKDAEITVQCDDLKNKLGVYIRSAGSKNAMLCVGVNFLLTHICVFTGALIVQLL